ncbi:WD40-repeat-containing domain protein [Gaertneriomyces semiglobifer]|nr:WD40-repeat-containing domain protein [Gaertneriomyces semiglobifer]
MKAAEPPRNATSSGQRPLKSSSYIRRTSGSRVNVASRVESASSGMRSRNTLSSGVFGRGSQQRVRASQSMLDRGGKLNQEKPIQVLDEDGNDVTPVSLLGPQTLSQLGRAGRGAGLASTSDFNSVANVARETVADVLNNLESMTSGRWSTAAFGRAGAMTRSQSTSSRMSFGMEMADDDDAASIASAESTADVFEAVKPRQSEVESAKQLTDVDLNAFVDIGLTETETITLLDLPAVVVFSEAGEEAQAVKIANERYKQTLNERPGNENFVERGMQTLREPLKNKDVQVSEPKRANAECMVTQWSIHDAYESLGKDESSGENSNGKEADIDAGPNLVDGADQSTPISQSTAESSMLQGSKMMSGSAMVSGSVSVISRSALLPEGETMSDVFSNGGPTRRESLAVRSDGQPEPPLDFSVLMGETNALAPLNQEALRNSLLTAERAVVLNNYEKKLLQYRNATEVTETDYERSKDHEDELGADSQDPVADGNAAQEKIKEGKRDLDSIPTVDFLWSYRCELTRGRPVMFLAWNRQNEDILAVAYGEQKPGPNPSAGLVLCWSVKNPEWPERIYRSKSPVTSIDFSRSNSNLLACGFADGRIAIYDVRRRDDKPVLDNSDLAGKHHDPVWDLRWVERERGDEQSRGETLVSVSTDGRVTQWLIRKGLEYTDLMTLKRVTRQQEVKTGDRTSNISAAGTKAGSFIARQSGGLCMDFNPKDSNIYMVGTDDGHIHRCSWSYNEQYLATYFGHTGPVNRVRWSPFVPSLFLSSSSDWTVRLWNQDEEEPLFKFQGGKDSISDVAWSPASSTVFGCVSTDGRMEIWDLRFSVLDPAILHTVLDRQLTSIIFALNAPVVLTGDDNGAVNVYKLRKLTSPHGTDADSLDGQAQTLLNVVKSKNQGT